MALINLALIVLAVLGVGAYVIGLLLPENIEKVQNERLPVAAVNYLNEHDLARELFNSYNWGGYLIFAAPDYPVYVDGRTDLYGDFVTDYARLYYDSADDLEAELASQNVNLVLVEKGAPITDALAESDNWTLEYEDDIAMIWVRSETTDE
jgi:hypothetical protein